MFSLHMQEKKKQTNKIQAITFSFVKGQRKYQVSSESFYNVHKYESSLRNEYPPEKVILPFTLNTCKNNNFFLTKADYNLNPI